MKLIPLLFRLHKYFSVIVGIQLLFWVLSGLYMTAVPIEIVHGDHLRKEFSAETIQWSDENAQLKIINTEIIKQPITSLKLFSRLGKPTYLIKTTKDTLLIDAISGQKLSLLSEDEAKNIALSSYTGIANILSINEITSYEMTPEIKGRALPIWQVNFDDWINSSLYVSNIEAAVTTVRSDIWRTFDFFWMLHIMDYEDRSDFNNPLVIFMTSCALFLILTGAILLINGINRSGRRYFR